MIAETTRSKDVEKIVQKIQASGRKVALPDESLKIIQAFGISVPSYTLVKTADQAEEASREIGFPQTIKIASPDALHKSDIGGVVLGLKNTQEVRENYDKIMDSMKRKIPDAHIAGALIQRQLPDTVQVIVGGLCDKQFGPAVMFGLGGIFVELYKDVSFRIAPVTETESMEMIKEIKAYPILAGYRGSKKLDITQLSETIIKISELITNINAIKEVELNPLLVYEDNVQAVDARVIIR